MKRIVSFSGGKDSTAMLLRMLELKYPIDEVLNCDTGLEFPAMYEHIAKIRKIVEDAGIKFTTIKADRDYEYYCFEHEYVTKSGIKRKGYGWTRGGCRWCTTWLKTAPIRAYKQQHFQGEKVV